MTSGVRAGGRGLVRTRSRSLVRTGGRSLVRTGLRSLVRTGGRSLIRTGFRGFGARRRSCRFERMLLVCHLEVGDIEGTSTAAGFDEHLGFVHLTHPHAEGFPLLEMSRDVDMATGTGVTTHAEILGECRSTFNGRLLDTGILPNFVLGAIHLEFTLSLAEEVCTRLAEPVIHDVVFYQRINRPAIDTDIVITTGTTILFPVEIGIDGANLLVSLLFVVSESDTSKEVSCIAPTGLVSTIIIIGHGIVAALVPDFIVVRRTADVTRHARVVLALGPRFFAFVAHLILTGIDVRICRRDKPNRKGKAEFQYFFIHL